MAMASVEEKIKIPAGLVSGSPTLLEEMKILKEIQDQSGAKKSISSELWHACAGPLVSLPQVGTLVYYFPQGHSEQVAVSTKRAATSHIPNYPNLPSQLMCQVHNVTLHADKDTDDIYAQMTLQPVNSEKDVFPFPDFGLRVGKHPSEFFCKTLTASDTSTHGGFSVPRRAAEKLFPPLDYSMQPPTQELIVRDLHDTTWTFRHIYRGQPKRHLLTTGWSLFVGSKRLKAGDSVLFIRDEKSQLMVGVRRANNQQTTLPSSVLSADSMHFGVLAAAAHAAANRSPFTIFYNPRACPSEFVIPLAKYQKSVYGTQVSAGMRFGMMFETEESGKRRYMGTVTCVSDLDPLRWPGSKWRNLQVEWDEHGSTEKQNRVSLWEIETPDSLFVFPSLTSSFKRSIHTGYAETELGNLFKRPFHCSPENNNAEFPYPPVPRISSEQLIKMLLKNPNIAPPGAFSSSLPPACVTNGTRLQEGEMLAQTLAPQRPHAPPLQDTSPQNQIPPLNCLNPLQNTGGSLRSQSRVPERIQPSNKVENRLSTKVCTEKPERGPVVPSNQPNQLASSTKGNEDKPVGGPPSTHDLINPLLYLNQQMQNGRPLMQQQQLEPNTSYQHPINAPRSDTAGQNSLLPYPANLSSQYMDTDDWMHANQSLTGILKSPGHQYDCGMRDTSLLYPEMINPMAPSVAQDMWSPQLNYLKYLPQEQELAAPCHQRAPTNLQAFPNSCGLRDFAQDSKDQSEIYNSLHYEVSNGGSTAIGSALVDPSVSSTGLDRVGSLGDVGLQSASDCMLGNFSSSQDVQSQITTASFVDSRGFPLQDIQDNSGGTSSSNVDLDESSLLQNSSWQQISQPLRTYTKVQKLGSVGRSIDVTRFFNYEELRHAIACMFGLEGLLDDSKGSEWKLVYVDYENDVLLVGDDPWEEFVSCVRCIRILSPTEVQQMSEEGLQLLSNTVM